MDEISTHQPPGAGEEPPIAAVGNPADHPRPDARAAHRPTAGRPYSDGHRGDGGGNEAARALVPFVRQRTVLLTSYRRDGTPVGTPVTIAVAGDRAYVRTWETAWKLKRIRRNPEVAVAPSTFRGKPTGPAIRARARLLEGEEDRVAGRAIARKNPLLQGVLVPLFHRLRRYTTRHLELTPFDPARPGATRGRAEAGAPSA